MRLLILSLITVALEAKKLECPKIKPFPLDFNRVSGVWFEHKRSANNWHNEECCAWLDWGEPENDKYFLLYTSQSKFMDVDSVMVVEGSTTSPGFIYHTPILGDIYKDHYILGTDYDNWGVVWLCENGIQKTWVFTRDPVPKIDIRNFITETFNRYNLTKPRMVRIEQENCKY